MVGNKKQIYIKRSLKLTKEGQEFYCSQVFQISDGLENPPKKPLLRSGKAVYILERKELAIPKESYSIKKDFTGKYQWAKIADVPKRNNIEFHKGNKLKDTIGCLLLGVGFEENTSYKNNDNIVLESEATCNWLINDFFLNDEKKKQTNKAEQDDIIGYITIA
jgi:hypothetical protein